MSYRVITGTLKSRTALHVGTGAGSEVTDALCRRDAAGKFILPGTAVGGVLRTVATRLAPRLSSPPCYELASLSERRSWPEKKRKSPCPCWVCHLFGNVNPGEGGDEESGVRASRLFIAHAKAVEPIGASKIRDGVGIDRASRAAARAGAVKFDLEVLPAGTQFELCMELTDADENDEKLLAATLAEWKAGRAWLGGRVARGLGAFDLSGIKLSTLDLTRPEGLMRYLRADHPEACATEDAGWLDRRLTEAQRLVQGSTGCLDGVACSYVTIDFTLSFDGFFLSNDTTAAGWSGFDHAPLLDVMAKEGKLILPGASLRGVLRTQAECIARTLATLEVAEVSEREQRLRKFLVVCPACNPLEARTGKETDEAKTGKESTEKFPLNSCDALLKKAGVKGDDEVRDEQLCLACRLFASTRRGSRFIVEDAMETRAFENSSKVLDFLAIDRFTGGARERAKFDAIASWQPGFAVRLHLENAEGWELGWLALVLRDLQDDMVTIGFGAAKGFGRAKIESYCLEYGFINEDDFCGPAEVARTQAASCHSLYRELVWDTRSAEQQTALRKLEQHWVERFHAERKQFARAGLAQAKAENRLPMLEADTFFDTEAEELYGKARIL